MCQDKTIWIDILPMAKARRFWDINEPCLLRINRSYWLSLQWTMPCPYTTYILTMRREYDYLHVLYLLKHFLSKTIQIAITQQPSTFNCLRKFGGRASYPHTWRQGLYGTCGKSCISAYTSIVQRLRMSVYFTLLPVVSCLLVCSFLA